MKKPKTIYIEAKRKPESFGLMDKTALDRLPKTIVLLYSVQYKPLARQIKKYLNSQSSNLICCKQILGCSKLTTKEKQHPLLLVGSGRFHALGLALQTQQPVYIYNRSIEKLSDFDIKNLKQKRQAALARFLASDKVGIIASTKPGQNQLQAALKLKTALKSKQKQAYIFISNDISIAELENFKIDSWVNTACPGLALDSPKLINIDELPEDCRRRNGPK